MNEKNKDEGKEPSAIAEDIVKAKKGEAKAKKTELKDKKANPKAKDSVTSQSG